MALGKLLNHSEPQFYQLQSKIVTVPAHKAVRILFYNHNAQHKVNIQLVLAAMMITLLLVFLFKGGSEREREIVWPRPQLWGIGRIRQWELEGLHQKKRRSH